MTAEIHDFDGITRLDMNPARVIEGAMEADLESVFIAGWTSDGEIYIAGSMADGGDLLWLIERAKWNLMQIADE